MYFTGSQNVCAFTIVLQVLLVLLSTNTVTKSEIATLKMVHILYRHGERAPLFMFEKDPNKEYWKDGPGQLTKTGMKQHYALGKYLRESYHGFLSDSYSAEEMYVRSSDMDRTLMSALSNLAGMFHLQTEGILDPTLPWQPIPVHTVKLSDDHLLHVMSDCPRYFKALQELRGSTHIADIGKTYEDLFEQMSELMAIKVAAVMEAFVVYDTLSVEKVHNLPIPAFAEQNWNRMIEIGNLGMSMTAHTREQRRLKGGPLLGEMTNNMRRKMLGEEKRKMFIYSGHDTTIAALLSTLDVFNYLVPPHAAVVMVELHQTEDGHAVQVLYKNRSDTAPFVLTIPGCSPMCPFDTFTNLTFELVPTDINKECLVEQQAELPQNDTAWYALGMLMATLVGMGGMVAILCVVVLMLAWIRRRRSAGYEYSTL